MSFLSDIGNFFGFGKKKDEDKNKPQVTTVQQPITSVPLGMQTQNKPVGVQMPQSLVIGQPQPTQPLGGVQTQKPQPTAPKPTQPTQPPKPTVQQPKSFISADLNIPGQPRNPMLDLNVNKPVPKQNQGPAFDVGKFFQELPGKLVSGVQQGAANVGDVALQGGALLDELALVGKSQEDADRIRAKNVATTQMLRDKLHGFKDVTGQNLAGTSGADEAATRIATGQGTPEDFAKVGGTGLQVGLDATMFANPTRLGIEAATTAPLRVVGKDLLTSSVGLGAAQGVATGAETLGDGGTFQDALFNGLASGGTSAAAQFGLGGVGIGVGRGVRSFRDSRGNIVDEQPEGFIPGESVGINEQAPTNRPVDIEAEAPVVTRDPNSPITSPTATTPKAPAITSPNQAAATVQAPPTFSVPESVGGRQPVVESVKMPEAPTRVPTADEATAAAQKAIDEAAVKPVEQPAPVEVVENPSPKAQATQEVIDNSTPVNAEQAIADASARAQNNAPTEAIADELGTISRKAAVEDRLNSDGDAQVLSDQVGNAIEQAALKTGSTWEEINKKVQAAWSKKITNYAEAGLTKEQFDVARKAADELSLLRSRVDPSLLKEGQVGQFYSPRQAKDTEFTQDLVNEISRGRNGSGLRDNELDLTTTPYRQAIRRYSNAPEALGDNLIDSLENKIVKDPLGGERTVPTGVKVPEDVKAEFRENLKPFIKAQDDALRAADAGDAKGIDAAVKTADKAIDDALTQMAAKLPKDTVEARNAIGALISERRAYMQSTARTNMFTNVVNRVFDQAQKGIVNFGETALPLVNKLTNKMTGTKQAGIATDLDSLSLAKKYSKGSLIDQQNRNFKTNVRLAGANAQNPLTKGLAKIDATYRAAGTYLTSLGDLSTNAVKATNLAILGKARAEGITGKANLESYLLKNLNTPEYLDIYRNMSNQYAGYIGMPQTLTSTGVKGSKASEFFSKIDNFVKNSLDNTPLPDRVKQELNDIIMPAVTGFAGATSRVAAKQLNALALGIPNVRRGLKLAASDSPNSKAIGQMMISRSIIDGVLAGGIGTAGALLGANGHWTGGYPDDPNERARWEKEGITPDSFQFQVGDKTLYIQPGRILGVLALPAVLPAVVADSIKNGSDPGEAISSIINGTIGQFNENLGADAIIQNLGAVNDLLNGNESDKEQAAKKLTSMLGYSLSNLNPAAGLQNNAANLLDDKKRVTDDLGSSIAARNPFTRPGLDVKKDNLGKDISNKSQLSLGSAAVTVGDGQQNENTSSQNADGSIDLDKEINRLAKAKFETVPARDVKNTNSQSDAKALLNSSLYQGADDETKASYLKEALLGTKTKDISTSLNPTQRQSLIEYTLQNDDQRKVWLESNDNAANYYGANFNNKQANGTLTSDDSNLQNKSGAKYKMIRAQVDQQVGADNTLKQLYDDISSDEWRAMTDPESEDYDLDTAGRLMAYDEARTKAGVSGKDANSSKPKYTVKTGGSGSGSGKSFSFASMPSSLIGVGGSSNGKSAYADDAPTFKPIADLKTPEAKAIPKGRSISVKKGIVI